MSKAGIRITAWFAVLCVVTFLAGTVSRASADGGGPEPAPSPLGSEVGQAATVEPSTTDPEVAEELPHEGLGREEAAELLEGVFEPEVEGPAGIYGDLNVEKFLAPNVVVIAPGEQPVVAGAGEESETNYHGATLMDSTLPLSTESTSGPEAVNLNLESTPDGLRPVNPLVEVTIPAELGEGLELPGPGIKIEPEGLVEARSPSTVDGSVAFYPNVAQDTDLAVAPDPGGVETLTQLRGPGSQTSETYRLDLPPGAILRRKGEGAVVTEDGETLMTVAPPSALDASGISVPTSLEVEGNRVTVTTSPTFATAYPVLVDPLFQSFEWYAKNSASEIMSNFNEGWSWKNGTVPCSSSTEDHMDALVPRYSRGLVERSYSQGEPWEGFCQYAVPRWGTEPANRKPETFIYKMTATDVAWRAESSALNPYMYMGLWGPGHGWASLYTHEGLKGHSLDDLTFVYPLSNETSSQEVKFAEVGMISGEHVAEPSAELFVGDTTIELAEPAVSAPKIGSLSGPSGWLRSGTATIHFAGEDQGLGLQTARVGASENPGSKSWTASKGCTGVAYSPCPYYWSGEVAVETESLYTGVDNLPVTLEDPLGHTTVGHVQVDVDHQAPQLTVSGSMTEQAKLGTALPAYTIHASAIDGVEKYPQSGVAKMTIKVDGNMVDESAPGCATEDCSLSQEWTLNSEKYAAGPHLIEVTAVDALGNTSTKTLWIQVRTTSPPTVSVSGSLTEQSSLGVTRPRYTLAVASWTAAQPETSAKSPPAFVSSFGSLGTGNNQFKTAGGVAIGPNGRLWVADPTNGRVEAFSPQGEYLFQFGTPGSGEGQLSSSAWNLAVDSSGDIWVADTGNNRVEEFSEAGKLIRQFGTKGTAAGQFNSPEGIAIDKNGNVWVSDRNNARLEKFNAKGEYLSSLALAGVSSLAINPAGELWVVQGSELVNVYSETGTLVKKVGRGPSPVSELRTPVGITIDPAGHVWIADRSDKVLEFGQAGSYGSYIGQFGAAGASTGQFAFAAKGTQIAADGSGFLWVSDPGNNRVQKWQVGLAPGSNSTEVLIDGKKVASTTANCMNEACRASTNWTLESSSYGSGPHTVTVKTADGDGRSTVESLPIELQRDVKGPQLTAGGSLLSAPDGWVGQHSYEVSATGSDEGSGVTQLELLIDGHRVGLATQECPNGGCPLSHAFQVNTAEYQGGSHEAALIATDGSGNRTTKRWTINVDPEGKAAVSEVVDTLEAADETAESNVVAPTSELLEPEQRANGDNPGLQVASGKIESTGVPDTTTISTNPSEGFTVKSPEGTTAITPVVASGASSVSVAEGVAGVAANVSHEVDSVIRPEYNGLQTFQAIRSAEAPETYSWRVHLAPHQKLRLANPSQAEVVYENGVTSFLITAEPAHDATGAAVPTSLEVSAEILTLRVAFHTKSFVYPIVAGAGWETSYTAPVIVQGPEDETQIRERHEREQREREQKQREGAAEGSHGWPADQTEVEGGGTEAEDEALDAREPLAGAELQDLSDFRQTTSGAAHRDPNKPVPLKEAKHILRKHADGPTIPPPAINLIGGPGGNGSGGWEKVFHVGATTCSDLDCDIWHVNYSSETNFALVRTGSGSGHQEYATPSGGVHCGSDTNFWWSLNLNVHTNSAGTRGSTVVNRGSGDHLTYWCKFHLEIFFVPDIEGPELLEEYSVLIDQVYPNGFQSVFTKHWNSWMNAL